MGGIQGQASGPYSSVDSQVNPSGNGNVSSSGNPGFSSIQTDELKVEYRAIADTYSRLRLPGDMRYNGSRVEVKQSCKDATYALTTSARYLETCLKIASYMQRVFMQDPEDFDCSQYVDKLLTYLMAHMRYLQEYFYALVV